MKYYSMEETAALQWLLSLLSPSYPKTIPLMIQKRIQYRSSLGITWSKWFNILAEDSELLSLQKTARYQLGTKLLNEYRLLKQ